MVRGRREVAKSVLDARRLLIFFEITIDCYAIILWLRVGKDLGSPVDSSARRF